VSSSVHRGHEVARGVDASPLAPLAFAAAAIHVWAAIEHASESAAIASAFVAMAVAQLLFGARLLRRTTPAAALMGAAIAVALVPVTPAGLPILAAALGVVPALVRR
jgi:hypothetical protein